MLDNNVKLAIAYAAIVVCIILFALVFAPTASAQPLIDKTKYQYTALCEINDINYVIYGDDVSIGGYEEGFVIHAPVMVNRLTGREEKIGKKIYLSRSKCFLLEK